jgi:hypothetical protein
VDGQIIPINKIAVAGTRRWGPEREILIYFTEFFKKFIGSTALKSKISV